MLSQQQRADLDRLVRASLVDPRDVDFRQTKKGWFCAYCPVCLRAERFRSTAAQPTRAEALQLLDVHLREGHSMRLAPRQKPVEHVEYDWAAILA